MVLMSLTLVGWGAGVVGRGVTGLRVVGLGVCRSA